MKTPQDWMESKGFGKMHQAHFTRLELQEIQEDAWKSAMIAASYIADQFADYDQNRDGRVIGDAIRVDGIFHKPKYEDYNTQ